MTHPASELILDRVYAHEIAHANEIFMTQPVGHGQVMNYTWAQTVDESRRMAAHLKSLGLPRAARIAILSKNCAHFSLPAKEESLHEQTTCQGLLAHQG